MYLLPSVGRGLFFCGPGRAPARFFETPTVQSVPHSQTLTLYSACSLTPSNTNDALLAKKSAFPAARTLTAPDLSHLSF